MADESGPSTSRGGPQRKRKQEKDEDVKRQEIPDPVSTKASRTDLPDLQFLVEEPLIRQITCLFLDWDALKELRLVDSVCDEAVRSSFRVYKKVDADRQLKHYWPKMKEQDHLFDTLFCVNREMRRIISFMTQSNITAVDLTALATFNITQLERAFKVPFPAVTHLYLKGVCISKVTWPKICEIFPNVTHIEVERQYIFFYDKSNFEGGEWDVPTLAEKPLRLEAFHDQKELQEKGFFDEESVYMMRCLKKYFKDVRSFFMH